MPHASLFQNNSLHQIRQYGFLPEKTSTALPEHNTLHAELNKIIKNLPVLLREKKLRSEIDCLNDRYKRNPESLITQSQLDRNKAMSMLTMLIQAYIFETPDKPKTVVPAVLADSILQLCKTLQRYPMLTYADYVLHNWQLINPAGGFTLENIEPIATFTGSVDEAWFIKIHIAIEAACVPALRSAYDASLLHRQMIQNPALKTKENETTLLHYFQTITKALKEATTILLRMKEHCDGDYFFNTLRLFLQGWDEKCRVTFEGNKAIHQYKGPSGAQSSILPSLDSALGIRHDVDGMFQQMMTFRQYMPSNHMSFIHTLTDQRLKLTPGVDSEILFNALKEAVAAVQQFRYMHRFALVGRFIYNPAGKHGIKPEQITGTGGTPINEFLEKRHASTTLPQSKL